MDFTLCRHSYAILMTLMHINLPFAENNSDFSFLCQNTISAFLWTQIYEPRLDR